MVLFQLEICFDVRPRAGRFFFFVVVRQNTNQHFVDGLAAVRALYRVAWRISLGTAETEEIGPGPQNGSCCGQSPAQEWITGNPDRASPSKVQ